MHPINYGEHAPINGLIGRALHEGEPAIIPFDHTSEVYL
jgi:hypothetical protein